MQALHTCELAGLGFVHRHVSRHVSRHAPVTVSWHSNAVSHVIWTATASSSGSDASIGSTRRRFA